MESNFKHVDLFGGAITVNLPTNFTDVRYGLPAANLLLPLRQGAFLFYFRGCWFSHCDVLLLEKGMPYLDDPGCPCTGLHLGRERVNSVSPSLTDIGFSTPSC